MPIRVLWSELGLGFNSLQTGKRIQSLVLWVLIRTFKKVSIPFKRESVSKEDLVVVKTIGAAEVSIPFKRESVSKGRESLAKLKSRKCLFQFPSNGKAYPKSPASSEAMIFSNRVSIPFKRESVSKETFNIVPTKPGGSFQFPSNGKAYPKAHGI